MVKRASEKAKSSEPEARPAHRPPRAGVAADETIRIRVTAGEKAQIEADAEAAGLSLSALVRARLLGGRVRRVAKRAGS